MPVNLKDWVRKKEKERDFIYTPGKICYIPKGLFGLYPLIL